MRRYIIRQLLLFRLKKRFKYTHKDYNLEHYLMKNISVGQMALARNRFGKIEIKEWVQIISVSGNHVQTIDRFGVLAWWYIAYILRVK